MMIFWLLLCHRAMAADLGSIGQTFPIVEPDLLAWIEATLHEKTARGDINTLNKRWRERVKQNTLRPQSVMLATTSKPITHYYDPSITAPHAIFDPQGKVMVSAGRSINPLEFVSLGQVLLFINADDPDQLKWVDNVRFQYDLPARIILVQGHIKKTNDYFQQPIYFDQQGLITTQLGITQVPALVVQDDQQLRIEEQLPCTE